MVLEGLLNIARGGMNTQMRVFERSAQNLANPYRKTDDEISADPAEALLDMRQAELHFKANAIVYETGVEFWDMMMMIKNDDE